MRDDVVKTSGGGIRTPSGRSVVRRVLTSAPRTTLPSGRFSPLAHHAPHSNAAARRNGGWRRWGEPS